ncbi:MAG: glutamine amidotransferase, partial [Myxococcota bacterium]
VLADGSRSLDLPLRPGEAEPRRAAMARALESLGERFAKLRRQTWVFGVGEPEPWTGKTGTFEVHPQLGSDLSAALEFVASANEELPEAVVVVSDGRLDRPPGDQVETALKRALGALTVPIHTVRLADQVVPDAAIAKVTMPEAVVAHQPVSIRIDLTCVGGLTCGEVEVVARELHADGPAVVKADADVEIVDGRASVELELTLDRSGKRIVELEVDTPEGDEVPANNRRLISVDVARDRVRLLHVAGRPTYDVRALRTWLKSDASVDVVAFFILRTLDDDPGAGHNELALIPFPVDELFTVHLSSFDAIVLQDFDAKPYGLSKHLPALAEYVKQGGGLIMVGGPHAFVSGHYANSPLNEVLPVKLDGVETGKEIDKASFQPRFTAAGKRAPVLGPLRTLIGERLPDMPGTNVVGQPREGATVLLEHPLRQTDGGDPMAVLALGESGSGRTIALTVDGAHKLLFSEFALGAAGRAHGAFWDALLGWLMRDPRFEPARLEIPKGCVAGTPSEVEVRALFAGDARNADVVVTQMGNGREVANETVSLPADGTPVAVPLGVLEAGGYSAAIRLRASDGEGSAPSRFDFACEVGGREWADVRPDAERLTAVSTSTGGVAVGVDDIASIPLPTATRVVAERRIEPLLPPWGWTLLAAGLLGLHWLARRRAGLV